LLTVLNIPVCYGVIVDSFKVSDRFITLVVGEKPYGFCKYIDRIIKLDWQAKRAFRIPGGGVLPKFSTIFFTATHRAIVRLLSVR
jgi:hypothetical protein